MKSKIEIFLKNSYTQITAIILCLFGLAMFAGILGYPYMSHTPNQLVSKTVYYLNSPEEYVENIAQTWDTGHYLYLETYGYSSDKKDDFRFAFFPLLPLEARFISTVLLQSPKYGLYLTSIINTIIFAGLLLYFYKSKTKEFNLEGKEIQTVLLALFLPFSFYYFVPYTESLFNLLLVSILIVLESKKLRLFYLGILLAFALSLTRSVGVFASVLSGIYLVYHLAMSFKSGHFGKVFWLKILGYISMIIASVAGLLSFLSYGKMLTGNFWISRDVQKYWGRNQTFDIWHVVLDNAQKALNPSYSVAEYCSSNRICFNGTILFPFIGVVLIFTTIIAVLIFLPKTKLNISIVAFSILAVLTPLTTNNMESYYRYIVTAPVYFLLLPALLNSKLNRDWYTALIVILAAIQGILMMFFANMQWIV